MKFYISNDELSKALDNCGGSVLVHTKPPEGVDCTCFNSRDNKTKTTISGTVWEAYSSAYRKRYGTDPIRNAMVNGQISNFLNRIPRAEACDIARFFVEHNDYFYVKNMHPVGLLLKDAEKLRTEWFSGQRMTNAAAKAAEEADFHKEQLKRLCDDRTRV